jgi:hypothetical protein
MILFVVNAGKYEANVELARIRAASEPVTAQELEEFYRTPDLDQDCTEIYLEVFATLKDGASAMAQSNLPLVSYSEEPKPVPVAGQPWDELVAVQKLLAEHNESLRLLHKAAALGGRARYPTRFNQRLNIRLGHPQSMYLSARLLSLEAHVKAHEGHAHEVVKSIQALIALARSLEREPVVNSGLARNFILGKTCDLLTRLMPSIDFAEDDLKQLQRDIRAITHREPLRRALLGDRVFGIIAHQDPNTAGVGPLPLKNRSLVLYLKLMRQLIAASKKPWPEVLPAVQAVDQEVKTKFRSSLMTRLRYAAMLTIMPPFSTCVRATMRSVAKTRATDAAIAAELYRREHGKWPKKLDQLVPKFLPEVPQDPFNGQSLRYLRKDGKLMIYSVDQNLVDNQGQIDVQGPGDSVVTVDRSSVN